MVSSQLSGIARILVLNAGSSSLKFKLFDQAAGRRKAVA
jgi:acetate kinase